MSCESGNARNTFRNGMASVGFACSSLLRDCLTLGQEIELKNRDYDIAGAAREAADDPLIFGSLRRLV